MGKKLLLALVLVGATCGLLYSLWRSAPGMKPEFQKGIHYVTWSKEGYDTANSDESLTKIKSLGANWVAILTTWYQDNCFSTEIFPTEKTPSDEGIIRAIKKSHELGMKVMLKPHLDILDTTYGSWRGEIVCAREEDWEKWFASYEKFIRHYVKIARENNVEMFCVGTELTEAAVSKPEMWRALIKDIRKDYKGLLTYAANWNEEYLNIAFWDILDYAGVDAYFPLSDKEKPTYDELVEGWKKWYPEIEAWQARINKPVIFPEVGYHSTEFAAKEPWMHDVGYNVELDIQVDCYRAMYDTFWDKEWFYGMYWWDWGTSIRMGGAANRGFTPQNKPAEELVKKWYGKKR